MHAGARSLIGHRLTGRAETSRSCGVLPGRSCLAPRALGWVVVDLLTTTAALAGQRLTSPRFKPTVWRNAPDRVRPDRTCGDAGRTASKCGCRNSRAFLFMIAVVQPSVRPHAGGRTFMPLSPLGAS